MVASEGDGRSSFWLPVIRRRFELARRLSLTNSVVLKNDQLKIIIQTYARVMQFNSDLFKLAFASSNFILKFLGNVSLQAFCNAFLNKLVHFFGDLSFDYQSIWL